MLVAVLVVLVLYALALPSLGFLIATPLMLGVIIWVLGLRAWSSLAVTAVGMTVVLWFVFVRLLRVLLPAGPL